VCPKSGLPDIYALNISYYPAKSLVELKSLKLYLNCYRLIGMFVEDIAQHIADDFWKAVNPHFVQITLVQGMRGGIITQSKVFRGQIPDNENFTTEDKKDKYETMG
jgi:7-cyano-7-deazaguanine reductase